jgi:hypothetical protein
MHILGHTRETKKREREQCYSAMAASSKDGLKTTKSKAMENGTDRMEQYRKEIIHFFFLHDFYYTDRFILSKTYPLKPNQYLISLNIRQQSFESSSLSITSIHNLICEYPPNYNRIL